MMPRLNTNDLRWYAEHHESPHFALAQTLLDAAAVVDRLRFERNVLLKEMKSVASAHTNPVDCTDKDCVCCWASANEALRIISG